VREFLAGLLVLMGLATLPAAGPLRWQALPPLPDGIGVAGAFSGVSGDALIVAGGANFPDQPVWEGGGKRWYDTVYVLPAPDGAWRTAGRLPHPLGYGVSLTIPQGILCIGGADADQHSAAVRLLRWNGAELAMEEWPALPQPCAYNSGAVVGRTVYVAGGSAAPTATVALPTFWALDLDRRELGWQVQPPCPGPARFLAVAGAQDGAFFLFGGAELLPGPDGQPTRRFLQDSYRFTPAQGWQRIADLPGPLAAGPGPAASIGRSHLLLLGGDDGTRFGQQLREQHPGFATQALAYHTITDTWTDLGQMPLGQVTTPLVPWGGAWVVPSGEVKPGVRTTAIWAFTVEPRRADFGWLNLLTLGLYPVLMLTIGWRCAGASQTGDEFFRGGRRIPWWAAGLSIYATMLSSITFMAIPAKAYATDWGFFLNYASLLLLAPLIIAVYLPFFRRLNVTSAYEYLEKRFNLAVRLFGSASFIVFQVARTGIVLFLPALALATVSDLDISVCIVGMTVLSILLTVFGGMEAVIWTDVAQSIILLLAALVALLVILARLTGSPGDWYASAAADGKFFGALSWSADLTLATVWVIFFGQLFTNFISYTSNQEVVQRYLTTRDEKQAARAIWANALLSLPSGVLFFAVGTALFVYYQQHPARLDPTLDRGDAIFPYFMMHELPAGMAGFVVAGIFAAAQPTSGLNSAATAFVTDFYARLLPGANDAARLRAGRVATVIVGILGMTVALTMVRYPVESLWELFLNLLGLTTGMLAGLFALGIFTRRAHGTGAILGVLCAAAVLAFVVGQTRLYPLLYGGVAVLTSCGVGYLCSLILPGPAKALEGLTIFTLARSPSPTTPPAATPLVAALAKEAP